MQELLILAILLVMSGLFSGSETALTSLSLARAQALHREGRRGATAVYRLKQDQSRMLITILIGNNLVNTGASALATVVATEWFGHMGPGIAVGVITLLLLVFGEITPKSLAIHYAERISLVMGPLIYALMRALSPLVWLFVSLTNLAHHLAGKQGDPLVTEAELISMVEHGEEEGTIETDEREMIERVFSLNDLRAGDVLTPVRRVFTLDGRRTLEELLPEVVKGAYSRIPLYGENPQEILKILFVRDLLEALVTGRTDITALEIGREPLFIPANQTIDHLLPLLRKHKQHMALVVDDTGYLEGVITLEDILEEVVGEIYDESDEAPEQYQMLPEGGILVGGHVELRVIEDLFDMELPGKPTDRVSHWILNHTARIPAMDEVLFFDNLEVRIHDASQRRIRQVAIRRTSDPAIEGEEKVEEETARLPAPG
jgi:CBS domain containing-hemolysin-like protein